MTRAEAYAEGFQLGRRWAEDDIAAHVRDEPKMTERNGWLARFESDANRAERIGRVRGYRDTWARYDAGTLTWEMLEHAPLRAEA